jgi:hypothetical protein
MSSTKHTPGAWMAETYYSPRRYGRYSNTDIENMLKHASLSKRERNALKRELKHPSRLPVETGFPI